MGHPTNMDHCSSTSISVSTINIEHYKEQLKNHYQLTPNISTGGWGRGGAWRGGGLKPHRADGVQLNTNDIVSRCNSLLFQ